MSLQGKRIILGVCGGIAAYKSAFLLRLLIKEGAGVRVVMTPEAASFIGPVTLSTLSHNPVGITFFGDPAGGWNNHVELGLWGDLMLIAPVTANTMAKMATGICDTLLLGVYLSARCPVYLAPAMDADMWKHPSTQKNVAALQSFGNTILFPESGELASGLSGEGRMAEPAHILDFLRRETDKDRKKTFAGKKVLITAGPTYEKIDAVRFIGNYSSGKMGFALAEAFSERGAEVTVVHGPVSATLHDPAVKMIAVQTAEEMCAQCTAAFPQSDIFIAAAAVADFMAETTAEGKIKKDASNTSGITLKLKRTPDILGILGKEKKPGQIVVGFALETENEMENARAKLRDKALDIVVMNSLRDAGAGFGFDTNRVTLLDKNGKTATFELQAKSAIARGIAEWIEGYA